MANPNTEVSYTLGQPTNATVVLQLTDSANVDIAIKTPCPDESAPIVIKVTTTATQCSWNLYATAKLPKPTQLSNHAPLFDSTSDGQIFRIGNTIFLPESSTTPAPSKPFVPAKFSLYIDSIERRDRYLFVTSRQKVTEIPELKDEPVKDGAANSKDQSSSAEDTKESTETMTTNSATTPDPETPSQPDEEKDESSSDESQHVPEADDSDSADDLSADESWSEASTDYASDAILPEFAPMKPLQPRLKSSDSDDSSSSEPDSDQYGCCSSDSDENTKLVEGTDKDGQGGSFSDDEQMWDNMWADKPGSSDDGKGSEAGYESDDLPDWNEFEDGFQPEGSDSEECSECGSDGGACALPPKDEGTPGLSNSAGEEVEEPVGVPVSQIHVYDMSVSNAQIDTTAAENSTPSPQPSLLFHFNRPITTTLFNSPPAVHPFHPLLVYPLGDTKILFADYLSNTYFVRIFRPSRFWSTHITVNCRFSGDGERLFVVAVERSGGPPVMIGKKKKGKAGEKKGEVKGKEKEKPRYELIISTYQMSKSKPTRAPPVLIDRVQTNLGILDVLPSVTWDGEEVYVSASSKRTHHIYHVDLRGTTPISGSRSPSIRPRSSKQTEVKKVILRRLTVTLPEWTAGRPVRFSPSGEELDGGHLIVEAVRLKIPVCKPVSTQSEKGGDKVEVAKDTATPISAMFDSSSVKVEEDKTAGGTNSTLPQLSEGATTPITTGTSGQIDAISTNQADPVEPLHPGIMTADLPAAIIRQLGGWRDVNIEVKENEQGNSNGGKTVELSFRCV